MSISVYAYRENGELRIHETSNPGCPGFEPGQEYVGCFEFPGEPVQLHWGWRMVPRAILGSVLDRIRKHERRESLSQWVLRRAGGSVSAATAIEIARSRGEITRRQAAWLQG